MSGNRQRQQQQLQYASEYEIVGVVALGDTTRRVYQRKLINGRRQNSYTEKVPMLKVAWRPTWYEASLLDHNQRSLMKNANIKVLGPCEGTTDLFAEESMWLIQKRDGRIWEINYGHLKREWEHALFDYYEKIAEIEDVVHVPASHEAQDLEEVEKSMKLSVGDDQDNGIYEDMAKLEPFITPDDGELQSDGSLSDNDENFPMELSLEGEIKEMATQSDGSSSRNESPLDRPRRSIQTPSRYLDQ